MVQERDIVYLVDGSSYIYRAYHAIRDLSNSKGLPTNAIFGFTKMILKLLEEFLAGNILDAQNRHLDCFYQILTAPQDSVFLIPRTPSGILGALVILTAFAHDLQFGIQQLTSNIHFVDPNNLTELRENVLKSERMRILSFTHLPDIEENENILIFGQKSPLRQYFSAEPSEEVYDFIARLFGDQSNAAKMRNFIRSEGLYCIFDDTPMIQL